MAWNIGRSPLDDFTEQWDANTVEFRGNPRLYVRNLHAKGFTITEIARITRIAQEDVRRHLPPALFQTVTRLHEDGQWEILNAPAA